MKFEYVLLVLGITSVDAYEVVIGGNGETNTFIRKGCYFGDTMVLLFYIYVFILTYYILS